MWYLVYSEITLKNKIREIRRLRLRYWIGDLGYVCEIKNDKQIMIALNIAYRSEVYNYSKSKV